MNRSGNSPSGRQSYQLRPSVLLYNRNHAELMRWTEALSRESRIRAVTRLQDLEEVLGAGHVDVIVCDWEEELFKQISTSHPEIPLIHCGATLADWVIEAAERGAISHADVDELQKRVIQLVRPRTTLRRQKLAGFSVRYAGFSAGHQLLELSNHGLAFAIDGTQDLEPFFPGTVLEDVQIFSANEVAFSGVRAIVRHLEVSDPSEGWYWVGCEIRPKETPRASERTFRIHDRAWCTALLRRALKTGGLLLQPADQGGLGIYCRAGQVFASSREFTVSSDPHSFAEYNVVRGSFEIGGYVYRFHTSVIALSPLTLQLPRVIEETQKRSSPRYQLSAGQPATVRLTSPLLQTSTERQVRDLGGTGFSFEFDAGVDVFPPGTCFTQVVLRVGNEEIHCSGQVKNLARVSNERGKLRCGVEFDDLEEETRVRIADIIMRSRFPKLQDGRSVSFDRLWEFFLETKFMYRQKQERLAPLVPELRRTLERLNSRPTKIFKSVVIGKGTELVGYISALRAYRYTWLSQHLAATQGGQGGRLLNFGMVEFQQNVDLEYFKIFYRPKNRWPARVFGSFARHISDSNLSDLRTYGYFTIESKPDRIPVDPSVHVLEATGDALRVVERYFVAKEPAIILKANDLTCNALRLSELSERFKELGLQRERHVMLALRGDSPVGFALAEISSPGLNFSELLSAFSIYTFQDSADEVAAVRQTLLHSVLALYRDAGRSFAVGLVNPGEVSQYQAFELQTVKEYSCWTCHRSLYMRFCDHVDRIVETIVGRQRKRALAQAGSEPSAFADVEYGGGSG